MEAAKFWEIEIYARFKENVQLHSKSQISGNKQIAGSWQQVVSTPEKPIKMTLKEPLNLFLQSGEDILETFTIAESKKWLKVIARNNSMLFFYKSKNAVRRFRIKFADTSTRSAIISCNDFVDSISMHVNVQTVRTNSVAESRGRDKPMDIDERLQLSSSDMKRKSISSLAENLMKKSTSELPSCYQSTNLSTNENQVSSGIKTCLLDPSFPAFVEIVEDVLKSMMTS